MGFKIAQLEKNTNWQATVQYSSGNKAALMRGFPGGEFDGRYSLCGEDWYPAHLLAGEPKVYSLAEVRGMLASGEISLVSGSVPG